MNLRNTATSACLATVALLSCSVSAYAATFNITQTATTPANQGNTILNSVTYGSGPTAQTFAQSRIIRVNNATRVSGELFTVRGDQVTDGNFRDGTLIGGNALPDNTQLTDNLNDYNLNTIVDVNSGALDLNIFFGDPSTPAVRQTIADNSPQADILSELIIFERGQNSDITVQGLNATGGLVGQAVTLLRAEQQSVGFSIDTNRIDSAQPLGYWELDLNRLNTTSISGVKLTGAEGSGGPDFDAVAVQTPAPPATLGLLALGVLGAGSALKRKLKDNPKLLSQFFSK